MKNDKIIATLNELIGASNDGVKAFARAAQDSRAIELTDALNDVEQLSRAASTELQDQVRLLGGAAREDGSMKAAARRGWTSVRAMMSPRDDQTILEECERAESEVRAQYAEALELDLPEPVHSLVERHHRAIVEGHYRVLDLRNRFRDRVARVLRATGDDLR